MTAPLLTESDIRQEIERIFAREHRSHLLALYGNGADGEVRVRDQQWRVISTRCELEMRAKMPMPGDPTPCVFLIDWTDRPLPVDLAARLANGRVYQIARDTRLATMFGARYAEPGLMATGLATVLLGGDIGGLRKVSGLQLSKAEAYSAFLQAWLGLEWREGGTLAELVTWCARDDRGPALVARARTSDAWERTRNELRAWWRELLGPLGEQTWIAWEYNLGRRWLQTLLLVDCWRVKRDPVGRGLLLGRLDHLVPGAEPTLGVELMGRTLDGLMTSVGQLVGEPAWWSQMANEAESLMPHADFQASLEQSLFLPRGHAARERALADALRGALGTLADDELRGLTRRLDELKAHTIDGTLSEDLRDARWMGAALVFWLATRQRRPTPDPHAPHWQRATDLARRYVDEGGFVDWCRQRLRRPLPFEDSLREALYAVLAAADAARRADDQSFANALPHWIGAGRPAQDVLPIDGAARGLITSLLESAPRRRLLVVLMDGMSWANAIQLLMRLGRESWSPVAWRAPTLRGAAQFPVVLAEVPTLTAQSRAAFFAGRHDVGFGSRATSEDTDRWRQNRALRNLVEAETVPELVFRPNLMNGEDLHPDVKAAVESDHRVIAVIVNAIDDQLRGSAQLAMDYSRVPIKPLEGLLHAADGAERAVLLVSDHGHVLGDGVRNNSRYAGTSTEGGRRWRTLRANEAPQPFEVKLPADTWKPDGSTAVAAIWDETYAHGQPNFGEHGGVSLAEVVAPALLIAPDWLASKPGAEDPDLACRELLTPGWWRLEVPGGATVRRAPEPPLPRSTPAPVAPQPLFPDRLATVPPPPVPMPPLTPRPVSALATALARSSIFKRQVANLQPSEVEKILRCVDALASDSGGTLSEAAFAEHCGILRRHVAGTVARLGVLNCDGFTMIEHNATGQQVILHRDRLVQQFGIET